MEQQPHQSCEREELGVGAELEEESSTSHFSLDRGLRDFLKRKRNSRIHNIDYSTSSVSNRSDVYSDSTTSRAVDSAECLLPSLLLSPSTTVRKWLSSSTLELPPSQRQPPPPPPHQSFEQQEGGVGGELEEECSSEDDLSVDCDIRNLLKRRRTTSGIHNRGGVYSDSTTTTATAIATEGRSLFEQGASGGAQEEEQEDGGGGEYSSSASVNREIASLIRRRIDGRVADNVDVPSIYSRSVVDSNLSFITQQEEEEHSSFTDWKTYVVGGQCGRPSHYFEGDWCPHSERVTFKYLKNLRNLRKIDVDSIVCVCSQLSDFERHQRTIVNIGRDVLKLCTNSKILQVIRGMYPDFENQRDVFEFQLQMGSAFDNIYILIRNPKDLGELAHFHDTIRMEHFFKKLKDAYHRLDAQCKTRRLNERRLLGGSFVLYGEDWDAYSAALNLEFISYDGTPMVIYYKCMHGLKSHDIDTLFNKLRDCVRRDRRSLFNQIHVGFTFHIKGEVILCDFKNLARVLGKRNISEVTDGGMIVYRKFNIRNVGHFSGLRQFPACVSSYVTCVQFYDEESHKLKGITQSHSMNDVAKVFCGNCEVASQEVKKPPIFLSDVNLVRSAIGDYLNVAKHYGLTARMEFVFTRVPGPEELRDEIDKIMHMLEIHRVLVVSTPPPGSEQPSSAALLSPLPSSSSLSLSSSRSSSSSSSSFTSWASHVQHFIRQNAFVKKSFVDRYLSTTPRPTTMDCKEISLMFHTCNYIVALLEGNANRYDIRHLRTFRNNPGDYETFSNDEFRRIICTYTLIGKDQPRYVDALCDLYETVFALPSILKSNKHYSSFYYYNNDNKKNFIGEKPYYAFASPAAAAAPVGVGGVHNNIDLVFRLMEVYESFAKLFCGFTRKNCTEFRSGASVFESEAITVPYLESGVATFVGYVDPNKLVRLLCSPIRLSGALLSSFAIDQETASSFNFQTALKKYIVAKVNLFPAYFVYKEQSRKKWVRVVKGLSSVEEATVTSMPAPAYGKRLHNLKQYTLNPSSLMPPPPTPTGPPFPPTPAALPPPPSPYLGKNKTSLMSQPQQPPPSPPPQEPPRPEVPARRNPFLRRPKPLGWAENKLNPLLSPPPPPPLRELSSSSSSASSSSSSSPLLPPPPLPSPPHSSSSSSSSSSSFSHRRRPIKAKEKLNVISATTSRRGGQQRTLEEFQFTVSTIKRMRTSASASAAVTDDDNNNNNVGKN